MAQKKHSDGFGAIGILIAVVVIFATSLAGWYVWHAKHNNITPQAKSNTVTNTKSDVKSNDTHKSATTANPYAGWRLYCDTIANDCFNYPDGWTLTTDEVSGSVTASIRNQSDTAIVSYSNPTSNDTGSGSFYTSGTYSTHNSNPSLKIVGGTFTSNYLPIYTLVDSSLLNSYPLTPGQMSTFENDAGYSNANESTRGQLTAYPVGQVYTSLDQSKAWFSTSDAQASLLIIESFYYK